MVWVDDPKEIVLVIGIIWGAIFVALRDLIQNMVGSLILTDGDKDIPDWGSNPG